MRVQDSYCMYRGFSGEIDEVSHGDGFYLVDRYGRKFLDLCGGPGVSCLGHSFRPIIDAMHKQLDKLPFAFASVFASDASEALASTINEAFTAGGMADWLGKAYFVCGGGEAVDLACKIAGQYWVTHAKQQRDTFAARRYGFHGVGMFTSGLSDTFGEFSRLDHLSNAKVIRMPGYLGPQGMPGTSGIGYYEQGIVQATREAVRGNSLAAIVVEPIGGPPVGAAAPSRFYLQQLRNLADEMDTLLIFDEIFCGSGRCGAFTAATKYGVTPDILILGKGISAGYAPLSAVCLSKKVVSGLGPTLLAGTTYTAHTMSCTAGAAALRYMLDTRLFADRLPQMSIWLGGELTRIFADHPLVYAIRGDGMLWALELRDPQKDPFPAQWAFHSRVRKAAHALGLIVYSKGQTVDGQRDYIMVTPPYEMPKPMITQGLELLKASIDRVFSNGEFK